MTQDLEKLAARVVAREPNAVARAISIVEDRRSAMEPTIIGLLRELGRRADPLRAQRIGITGPPGVGTKVTYKRKLLGREVETTSEMVAHEPPARLRMKSETALFAYLGGYDLRAEGDRTHLHYQGEITTRPLLGLVGRAIAGQFQSAMEGDLQRLKRLLESRPA